jgi:hypothetical protein
MCAWCANDPALSRTTLTRRFGTTQFGYLEVSDGDCLRVGENLCQAPER